MRLLLFAVLAAISYAQTANETIEETKVGIINGQDAEPNKFPFYVQLYKIKKGLAKLALNNAILAKRLEKESGTSHCGGTLISDCHVLTAAHCVCDDGGGVKKDYGYKPRQIEKGYEKIVPRTLRVLIDKYPRRPDPNITGDATKVNEELKDNLHVISKIACHEMYQKEEKDISPPRWKEDTEATSTGIAMAFDIAILHLATCLEEDKTPKLPRMTAENVKGKQQIAIVGFGTSGNACLTEKEKGYGKGATKPYKLKESYIVVSDNSEKLCAGCTEFKSTEMNNACAKKETWWQSNVCMRPPPGFTAPAIDSETAECRSVCSSIPEDDEKDLEGKVIKYGRCSRQKCFGCPECEDKQKIYHVTQLCRGDSGTGNFILGATAEDARLVGVSSFHDAADHSIENSIVSVKVACFLSWISKRTQDATIGPRIEKGNEPTTKCGPKEGKTAWNGENPAVMTKYDQKFKEMEVANGFPNHGIYVFQVIMFILFSLILWRLWQKKSSDEMYLLLEQNLENEL